MVIFILSEERSGTQSIYQWLQNSEPNTHILFEPLRSNSINLQMFDPNKNYIILEKFHYHNNTIIEKLIDLSDINVALYREDIKSQIESYIIAKVTGQWYGTYSPPQRILDRINTDFLSDKIYFESLKKDFKIFREKYNLKTFTYEDLFYGDKIVEFKEYLRIKTNISFPIGKRYRVDIKPTRLI